MLSGLLHESKLSAVYCETHLPRCSVTVYAARVVLSGWARVPPRMQRNIVKVVSRSVSRVSYSFNLTAGRVQGRHPHQKAFQHLRDHEKYQNALQPKCQVKASKNQYISISRGSTGPLALIYPDRMCVLASFTSLRWVLQQLPCKDLLSPLLSVSFPTAGGSSFAEKYDVQTINCTQPAVHQSPW